MIVNESYRNNWRVKVKKDKDFFRKFILTCNPWFLSSTVVLLIGIYSLYTDPEYANDEIAKITFSFTSLQIYEFLALGTVFFFKRLKLLHDSVLLIVIGSLLLFVPYINLSHANILDEGFSLKLGLLTFTLSLFKLSLLKGFYKDLNLPPMLLFTGLLLALSNYLVPGFMHKFNGQTLESQHFMNLIWEVGVPLIALSLYLTLFRLVDGGKLYQRKWLPLAIASCWVIVSLINFFSINYVYSIEFRGEYIALLIFIVLHVARLMYPKKGSPLDLLLLTLCAVAPLFLRLELPVHFAVMLCINAIILLNQFKTYKPFILVSLLGLLLHGYFSLTEDVVSHYRFLLIGAFILSSFYAIFESKYEHSLIVGSLYVLVFWELTHTISLLTYFQAFSIFMAIFLLWEVGKVIEGRFVISGLSITWLVAALYVGVNVFSEQVGFIAGLMLAAGILRIWVFHRFIPKTFIYCSLIALLSSCLMTYLSTISRSFFIIMISFTIFGLGIYMSFKKSKVEHQLSD
jgi:hypothetical protein